MLVTGVWEISRKIEKTIMSHYLQVTLCMPCIMESSISPACVTTLFVSQLLSVSLPTLSFSPYTFFLPDFLTSYQTSWPPSYNICVSMSVRLCEREHICESMCACACMCSPDIHIKLLVLFSMWFFEAVSLTKPRDHWFARLAGQWAPEILASIPLLELQVCA